MQNLPKFRAWIKSGEFLTNVRDIDFEHKMISYSQGNSLSWKHFDEIELMQSTGLFDKNKREIYTEYIVKISHILRGELQITKIASIKFDENTLSYDFRESFSFNEYYTLAEISRINKSYGTAGYFEIEIIGNTFQNSNLLKP